jgi:hypothetical protein
MYIDVNSIHRMRIESSREAVSVNEVSARLSGENTPTSSGCRTYDVCGGKIRELIVCSMQRTITFAVM